MWSKRYINIQKYVFIYIHICMYRTDNEYISKSALVFDSGSTETGVISFHFTPEHFFRGRNLNTCICHVFSCLFHRHYLLRQKPSSNCLIHLFTERLPPLPTFSCTNPSTPPPFFSCLFVMHFKKV